MTIRIDNGIIEWFRAQIGAKDDGSYRVMINDALKESRLSVPLGRT
jgi:uncharacterized protein (DUF4415 family)